MHPLNPYRDEKPDFAKLASTYQDFAPFVDQTPSGYASIDFKDVNALRALTCALLKEDWGLDVKLRSDRLVPTIANRLDYLLHVLDIEPYLRSQTDPGPLKLRDENSKIRIIDIGTGSSAIYPILLHRLRPNASIIGTELNQESLDHAQTILTQNNISHERLRIQQAIANGHILFPLDSEDADFDISICNPPFFASEEEISEGQDLKLSKPHAAATAAENELITPGGEVEFVSRMIKESLIYREKCKWYTSLIGKYSSLQPLVDLLRSSKVDNYFVKSIKPAKTVRWILAWSHTAVRLPDSVTRPETVYSGTSFSRLLPPSNQFKHTPLHPPYSIETLREVIHKVLRDIQLLPSSTDTDGVNMLIEAKRNTWSRAARRLTARGEQTVDEEGEPLMRLRVKIMQEAEGAGVQVDWLWGRDRSLVEGFWKFVISKAGLLGKGGEGTSMDVDGERSTNDGENSGHVRPNAGEGVGYSGGKAIGWSREGRRGRGRNSQSRRFREDTRDSGWGKALSPNTAPPASG